MTDTLLNAEALAIKHHAGQVRKANGAPYVEHLIEVVELLQTSGVTDELTLASAWLHDVLEDTDCTEHEIERLCGSDVLHLVKALTDDKTLSLDCRREAVLEKVKSASTPIRQIKLADITSNKKYIPEKWSPERVKAYVQWLDEVAQQCQVASNNLYNEYLSIKQ